MRKLLSAVVVIGVIVGGTWWLVHAATSQIDSLLPHPEECTARVGTLEASLDPEQAGNAATIAAIGLQRGLPARAATIAIATAMQESKLYNITTGDRDSLGLFQQRPSQGWGTEEQVLDPAYATNRFYDKLIKIHGYRQMVVTEAAQKVQRSAYPEAYGDHEDEGRALASTLTGYSPRGFTCRIDEPTAGSGKPRALARDERQLFKGLVRQATVSGHTVTVPVGQDPAGRRSGWAAASYALAQADAMGVTSIAYDGQRWSAGHDREWEPASDAPRGRVVITLA